MLFPIIKIMPPKTMVSLLKRIGLSSIVVGGIFFMKTAIGEKYNHLTVVTEVKDRKVVAECICGSQRAYHISNLRSGKTKSCGCISWEEFRRASFKRAEAFLGKKYHSLTVSSIIDDGSRGRKVLAVCDCGVEKKFVLANLTSGKTTSCGCVQRKAASERFIAYNKTRPGSSKSRKRGGFSEHPIYIVWCGMLRRCYNKKDISFKRYGGKGVIVCEEWKNNFMAFYTWAVKNGYSKGLQIDKDKKGNGLLYSPRTCSFVTRKSNCRTRTTTRYITYRGKTRSLAEWCEIYKLNHSTVIRRIANGWPMNIVFKSKIKNTV